MLDNESIVIGLDLGGTNTRLAAIKSDGSIVARRQAATPIVSDPSPIIDQIARLARECAADASMQIVGLGAAVPATFKAGTGILSKLPNIPALNGVDIVAELNRRLDTNIFLLNDATAATVGEHWLGAGRGESNVIGYTLGTGVGGGIIINDEVVMGADGTAGEIGHVCVEPRGWGCGCGSNGCLEQYASGRAILRAASDAGISADSPKDVFEIALAGNNDARRIFTEMGHYLGIAIAALVNTLNPKAVIIAGGVAAAWDLYIDELKAELGRRAFPEPVNRARIVRAALGDDAGVLGAAKLTFKNIYAQRSQRA